MEKCSPHSLLECSSSKTCILCSSAVYYDVLYVRSVIGDMKYGDH